MSLEFTLNVESLDKLKDQLSKVKNRVTLETDQDRTKLAEKLQKVMFNDLKKRFLSSPSTIVGGEVYGGEYWKHLSDYTLALKPERMSGQVYIDSGELKKSLTYPTTQNISRIDETTNAYEFGTRLPYAENLQQMRPIIFLHRKLLLELVEAYEEFIVEELENKDEEVKT